jgi:hypothetical protein
MAGEVGSLKATLEFDLGDAKSILDDFRSSFDELKDALNERFSLEMDAGGATSALDDAIGKADQFKDTADQLRGTEISADSSGFTSAVDSASSSTDGLAGQIEGLKSTIDTAFDIAIVAAFAAAIYEAGDAVMDLAEKFAEMQDASQRAAMFGNTAMGDMQSRTAQIMEQADIAAVKFGVPSEQVAGMIGTFAQFGTTQLSQDQINAAVGAARGMQLEPADLARGIQSAYTTTQGTYSQQALLDMFSRAYMTTGLQPTTQISTALTKLQPMGGELGGFQGELAALMYGTQIMPGGRGVNMIASGLESFDKQLNETYLTVDTKGKAVIKGSEDIYNAFSQAGLNFTQEQARGPLQALNDLYEAGQRMGKDFFPQAFGSQAGIMEALGAGLPKIQEYKSILEGAGGSTEDLAAKVDDLQMSLDRMDEAFGNMGEAAGSLTEGPLRNMADFVAGPLLDGFNSIIDKLKSGDIKGALQEAFDLGDIILKAPIEGLEYFRNQILSFDWRDLGHTVASILGDEMSQINIDAGELGKTVAAGLAAAIEFARGAFSWDVLFGKTPLDAFLKPIEKVMSAEFGLMAAEMKLKMAEGSQGAIQSLYSLHDKGVTALAGLLTSVQILAGAFATDLYNAIKSVYDWFTNPWNLDVNVTATGGGGGTSGGGGSSVSGTSLPIQKYENVASSAQGGYYSKTDDAEGSYIQSLYSYSDIINSEKNKLIKLGGTVEVADAQIAGIGYVAQSWGLGQLFPGTMLAQTPNVGGWLGATYDYWTGAGSKQTSLQTGTGNFLASELATGTVLEAAGVTNLPGKEPIPSSPAVLDNTDATDKNTYELSTNSEYNQRLADNLKLFGGLWGDYTLDLAPYQQAVDLATGTLEEAKAGLKSFGSDIDQTGDSADKTSGKINALGESCTNCAQANQNILGYLQGLTGTENLDPGSFRAAVESLGTMYQESLVAPSLLYQAAYPEREPARLGAIAQMPEAEYQAYLRENLALSQGTTVSGIIGTSQAYLPPEGASDDWLACAAGASETAQKIDLVTGAILGSAGEFLNWGDAQKHAQQEALGGYSEFREGVSDIQQQLKDPATLKVMTDSFQAEQDIDDLTKKAESDKKMPIILGGAHEARAQIDDLTQPEFKYIYITTIKTTVSSGGVVPTFTGVTGGIVGAAGTWGLSGVNVGDFFSSFQNEAFVPRPTLAVVGDRPGGEYVLSAERVERMGRGGGGIQITYAPTINGSGLSTGELEYILDQQREKLIDDAAQEAAFRQWR